MGRHDWYRRRQWTDEDRGAFRARFARSRGAGNKAQYLLIQAETLLSTGSADLVLPALELAEEMLREHPEKLFLSNAHYIVARCLVALGRENEALAAYRDSFAARRNGPGVQNAACLDFAWLIVERGRHDLYEEALKTLDEFAGDFEMLPVCAYRSSAARALIWVAKGDTEQARAFARQAIDAAAKRESPFRYHRDLGLVQTVDDNLHRTLLALVAAQQGVAPDGRSPAAPARR